MMPVASNISNDRRIAIDGVTVVEADALARNGLIHFIDAVLRPPMPDLLVATDNLGFPAVHQYDYQCSDATLTAADVTDGVIGGFSINHKSLGLGWSSSRRGSGVVLKERVWGGPQGEGLGWFAAAIMQPQTAKNIDNAMLVESANQGGRLGPRGTRAYNE